MSHLALYLFGPPRMERDGVVVNVDTRKAVALLAYLAVTRQRHSRDALAGLLWPEYDQPHARATLRRTLSALNKALAGGWLDVDRETVGLDQRSSFWLDIDEFHAHLAECRTHNHPSTATCPACLGPLSHAAQLYRDDFMAGFSLHDSSNFDDWQFFQADSLRRELASVLERLVQCHSALADYEAAVGYARRWLTLDRLHEPAHRALMQLYAWSSQRTAAIYQYQECVQILEQELGVVPLEATTELYQAIKANQAPPPPTQAAISGASSSPNGFHIREEDSDDLLAPMPSQPLRAGYPLVGRAVEWTLLTRLYTNVSANGHLVMIEGEAGIGKTRLAEDFVEYARQAGAVVLASRCYEGETSLAYGPIVSGLRAAIAQQPAQVWQERVPAHWASEVARLLPELTAFYPALPPAPPLDGPGAQIRFFEGLRQMLLALCQRERGPAGVLYIDDVHWADSASLEVLSYLVRRLRELPLFLLLTYRNTQLASTRLHHILSEAQRPDRYATILSLERLNQDTIKELIQAVTPVTIEPPHGLVERLYQETEGLPFFLIEYLTAMTQGVLAIEDTDWSLPGGVRDLLHSRLSAVKEPNWQLLSTAATIGRSFDFDTLREASGRSEEETVAALEEFISQGLIKEIQSSSGASIGTLTTGPLGATNEERLTYDFSHEKLRSLVYEETSQARRRLLHRRIAEVLVARNRNQRTLGQFAGQIAHHYHMAGNDGPAAEYFRQAGERARELYAHTEALAHFRAALILGYPDSAQLLEAIGDLHTFLGEYGAALKSYEKAAALENGYALARIEHKLGSVHERRGEWDEAESRFEAALRAFGEAGPPNERARVYADWSLASHHRGNINQALDLAHRALDLAEVVHDPQALAQAHNMLGMLANSEHEPERAIFHLEQSLSLAQGLRDPALRAAVLNNLAQVYRANGEIERAITFAESALALCIAQGDRHREAALHSTLSELLHEIRRDDASMSHLKRAVSIYGEIGVEAGAVQLEIWKLAEW